MVESPVSAPALHLSVPQSPANCPMLLDLQVHLVPLDLQDLPETLDHRVLQVKADLVLQDAKVPQDLQGSAHLDLKVTKENLVAFCQRQKPSLQDHQDLQDPQAQRVQQVNPDHQGSKGNQASQDFLEARENQAMVSLVGQGPRDHRDPLDCQVQPPHRALQAPQGHRDRPARMAVALLM